MTEQRVVVPPPVPLPWPIVDPSSSGGMLEYALYYASHGYPVHPVHGITGQGLCTCGRGADCRSAGKHPVFSDWVSLASTDPAVIQSWRWDGYNIGVVPRGEFFIIDLDGPMGLETFERMLEVLPELPETTPIQQTGSGGVHVFLGGRGKSDTRVLPGLDIRGEGGQAVLPPSMHLSGNRYQWIRFPSGTPPMPAQSWQLIGQKIIPDVLQPEQDITLDNIRWLAKRSSARTALTLICQGEPFAEPGIRDTTLMSVCGAIARRWPNANPISVARLLSPSLTKMSAAPGAPSFQDVVDKYSRCAQEERTRRAARPRIRVTTDIVDMAEQAMDVLLKLDIDVFKQAGQLVHVVVDEGLPDLTSRSPSPPKVVALDEATLCGLLSTVIDWYKVTPQDAEQKVLPHTLVVRFMLKSQAWKDIRPLEGVQYGPLLRVDGSYFPGGGYDERSGILCLGPPEQLPVISIPECILMLAEAVCDFPFESKEFFSAWVAGVLTSVARPCIAGPTPLFLIDANVRGAGKTLLAHVASIIGSESGPSSGSFGSDNEENRKQITALAMAGARIILADNVSGLFGSAKLNEALSLHTGVWSDRVLGVSQTWQGPFTPTWWATGNNVRLSADMPRRVCYIRLQCKDEKPELRTEFVHPSLMTYIIGRRKELQAAAMVMLKSYFDAGLPQSRDLPSWGGYEEWSRVIRGCCVWCGLPDPADTRRELDRGDEDHDFGLTLVMALREVLVVKGPSTAQELLDLLYDPRQTYDDREKYKTLRDCFESSMGRGLKKPTTRSIGRLLMKYRGRTFGRYAIQQIRNREWTVQDVK